MFSATSRKTSPRSDPSSGSKVLPCQLSPFVRSDAHNPRLSLALDSESHAAHWGCRDRALRPALRPEQHLRAFETAPSSSDDVSAPFCRAERRM